MAPRSPIRISARLGLFTDPFRGSAAILRPTRSSSVSSTASSDASSDRSRENSGIPFSSMDGLLELSRQLQQSRSASCASVDRNSIGGLSVPVDGSLPNRRPSCYSIIEAAEERAEFGDKRMSVLEPRNSIGWWGVKEVLTSEKR